MGLGDEAGDALAVLVAAEEGTVDLDEPAGPPGSTVRHLLAHASGLPFEGREPIGQPGARRIYSNTGFDVLGELVAERAEMPFEEYLRRAVLEPLGMSAELRGSAGSALFGSLDDLTRLARELQQPTLVAPETLAEATTVQFPGLAGVIPEMGRFDLNDWGLGFELKDEKPGHWSGTRPAHLRSLGRAARSSGSIPMPGWRSSSATSTSVTGRGTWPKLSDAVYAEATTA